MKNKLKNQFGLSTLVLVFIIVSLLTLIISVLILVTFLAATRAAQSIHAQKAFFAAEGSLYETIQRLRDYYPDWPNVIPNETTYIIGNAQVKRTISQTPGGQLEIVIETDMKGAKRKLVGYYQIEEIVSEEPVYSEGEDCDGLEVNVEFENLVYKDGNNFWVGPGQSWVKKGSPFAFTTYCNNTASSQYIAGGGRKWFCDGICPHFYKFYDNVSHEGEFEAGNIIRIGKVAILDDDLDGRKNCIILNAPEDLMDQADAAGISPIDLCEFADSFEEAKLLYECEEPVNFLSQACEYQLTAEDLGEEETARITVIHEDSVGVDALPHIVTETGETFWFEEEVPEPD